MKRESKPRAGGSRSGEQTITKYGQRAGKIFSEKRATRLSKAHVKRIAARRVGREAAYEELVSQELCRDLAFSFARESSKRTGDQVGNARDGYEAIALEFRRLGATQPNGERQQLSSALVSKYETLDALKEWLPKLGKWIREYAFACIRGKQGKYTWSLSGHRVSNELLTALAEEYDAISFGVLQALAENRCAEQPAQNPGGHTATRGTVWT